MIKLENITEAVITYDNGAIEIVCGHGINKKHSGYHDRVSITKNDKNEIEIQGHNIYFENISGIITEQHKNFELYCKNIINFNESIEYSSEFSWRKFKIIKIRYVQSSCFGRNWIYKPELWKQVKYNSNNWVIKETQNNG